MKRKILIIYGTRAEFIKLGPLILALIDVSSKVEHPFEVVTCSTGQHKDLLPPLYNIFGIKPNIDLRIGDSSPNVPELTSIILSETNKVIQQVRPDLVIIQGDTSSSLGGALASFYNNVKIMHLEAGMRTGDNKCPFPEEIHRKMISDLASYHVAVHQECVENLLREGKKQKNIVKVNSLSLIGLSYLKSASPNLFNQGETINNDKSRILVTCHRRENAKKVLVNLCSAIKEITKTRKNVAFDFIIHPNPNIKAYIYKYFRRNEYVKLIPSLSYEQFIEKLINCSFILTDSAGVQEEAYSLNVPAIIFRERTERGFMLKKDEIEVSGTKRADIIKCINKFIELKFIKKRKLNFDNSITLKVTKYIEDVLQHYSGSSNIQIEKLITAKPK